MIVTEVPTLLLRAVKLRISELSSGRFRERSFAVCTGTQAPVVGSSLTREPGSDAIVFVIATSLIHDGETLWQEGRRVDLALFEGAMS